MKTKTLFLITPLLLGLAACNEPDANAPGTDTPVQNAPVDKDPTPQTGTGGESQNTSPDGTASGAPETPPEKPLQ